MVPGNNKEHQCERLYPGRCAGILYALLIVLVLAVPAGAFTTPESIVAATKLSVTNITYDPEVFFTGDSGTVTFEVTNGATDQGIAVNHASMDTDNRFRITNPPGDYTVTIGPGRSQTFAFLLVADAGEGKYFPAFSLSLRDADNLRKTAVVQIDNTPLMVTLHGKPDTFTRGKKDTINVQVANPRNNAVKNVILDISGEGMEITPAHVFIGPLGPGENRILSPTIIPSEEGPVTLKVLYDNGDNPHVATSVFPLEFTSNKKQAAPVISNVMVKNENGIFHVTGDVTNAGLESASGVTVTSLPPARADDPFRSYVVGELKPDDFASFEVTFRNGAQDTVPLQVSYKDADGNIFSSIQDIGLGSAGSQDPAPATSAGTSSSDVHATVILILAAILLIALLAMGGMYLYNKHRGR